MSGGAVGYSGSAKQPEVYSYQQRTETRHIYADRLFVNRPSLLQERVTLLNVSERKAAFVDIWGLRGPLCPSAIITPRPILL